MSTTRPHGSLYTKITNGVATILFAHPENNALGITLIDRLLQEFEKLSNDDTVKIILISSEDDRAFCTGVSLRELATIRTIDEGIGFFAKLAQLYQIISACKKIIIGRVQGKTTGEGVALLAACDAIFATDAASLQLPELSLAMLPILGTSLVVDKIGKAGFNELALTPTGWKNAYWGKEKGLFATIFEEISEMDKELDFFTTKLATYSGEALYGIKEASVIDPKNRHKPLEEYAKTLGKQLLSNGVQEILVKIKNS